ncbi:hypothetical protein JJV70_02075 [Streptomyces sp. JJ66]|uniref:hypothetical protein n=1 Tax=Streptomyces sp. JJ66 TaxID=2803843 RepID=UPI001C576046|nr:hypothetical protein [Streptomyces sp. JJ66]MBW1600908.1 hypothetical protein [Streptomyces sp. JJ66]
MRIFGREPALVIGVISAGLSLLVTFNVGLTSAQAGGMVALLSALGAAATAAVTRPVAPAAFTGVVAAGAALAAAFGFEVAPETVGALNAAVLAVLALLTRGQVSPAPAVDSSRTVRS